MKSPDGATMLSWYSGVTVRRHPPLQKSSRAEVCVVGAGIAGLTVAYFLLRGKVSVIVLDEGPIGSGQTGRTSAHLASAIDDRFLEIENMHGRKGSQLAYESHAAAIDELAKM